MELLDNFHAFTNIPPEDDSCKTEQSLALYPANFESFTEEGSCSYQLCLTPTNNFRDLGLGGGFFTADDGISPLTFTCASGTLGASTIQTVLTTGLDVDIPSDISSHLSPDSGIAGGESHLQSPESVPRSHGVVVQDTDRLSNSAGISLNPSQGNSHSTINIASYAEQKFQRKEAIVAASTSLNFLQDEKHMMNDSNAWAPALPSSNIHTAPGEHPYLHEHSFVTARQCLDPTGNRIDTCTAFNSYVEAKHWREKVSKVELDEDRTIPHSTEQEKAMVKVLFKAFKSIDGAVDNEAMIRPFRAMAHDNARVEVVCWQILKACIMRSKYGSLVSIFDPSKTKPGNNIRTFADRFDHVVNAIYSQKTICKHLFDPPFVNTFVDDPIRAKSRVESNRALNEKKGRTMAAGKAVTSYSPKKRKRVTSPKSATPDAHSDMVDDVAASSYGATRTYSTSAIPTYSMASMPMSVPGSSILPQTSRLPQSSTSAFMSPPGTYYQHLPRASVTPSNIRPVGRAYTTDGSYLSGNMYRSLQPSPMPNLNQVYVPSSQSTQPVLQDPLKTDHNEQPTLPRNSPFEALIESPEVNDDSDHSEYVEGPPNKRTRRR